MYNYESELADMKNVKKAGSKIKKKE